MGLTGLLPDLQDLEQAVLVDVDQRWTALGQDEKNSTGSAVDTVIAVKGIFD